MKYLAHELLLIEDVGQREPVSPTAAQGTMERGSASAIWALASPRRLTSSTAQRLPKLTPWRL